MPDKYTHGQLTKPVKSPGWRLVTGKKDGHSITGTLEHVLGVTHERRKGGQAPGLIEEIETKLELEMIQIELFGVTSGRQPSRED
jgi:hypothetical protein